MNVLDSVNIAGLSEIIDYGGDINLDELEQNIINDVSEPAVSIEQQVNDFGNIAELTSETKAYEPSPMYQSSYESHDIDRMASFVSKKPFSAQVTEEQKKRRILSHILDDVEGGFSMEKEKEEEQKVILLENIDTLMTSLTDDGADLSRIPTVTTDSPIEEIENVHKILRIKNDRSRYCTFAEELILAGSSVLEMVFDGKKTYLGRQPDLRGWSSTVSVKLRRMRYDTSTFVSNMMQGYDFGHGLRIALELLPSVILYSKMRKSQYNDNLITSDEMSNAINKIRDIENQD